MRYPINHIFYTIQGEATFTGTPAVFVRFQGCPVGCAFCDTKYTWEVLDFEEVEQEEIEEKQTEQGCWANYTIDELISAIYKASNDAVRHVVFTGGEPCLYDLKPLCEALEEKGITVQIETSGTHDISATDKTWVTVSPKINMTGGFEVKEECIKRANEIKHPVGKQQDFDNLMSVIGAKPNMKDIWLQPLSQNKKATELCVKLCYEHGCRISIQTHKYLGLL